MNRRPAIIASLICSIPFVGWGIAEVFGHLVLGFIVLVTFVLCVWVFLYCLLRAEEEWGKRIKRDTL